MRADDILSIVDLKRKTVHVREWDTDVQIQELDLATGLDILGKAGEAGKVMFSPEEICTVVAYGVINGNGKRVFGDKDIPALQHKNRNAITFLYREIMSLSGTIEDARKNSKASQD